MNEALGTEPLLAMSRVSRTYGRPPSTVVALDEVDVVVSPGEMVAVMGPSGSGKSTLLTIAGGLEAVSSGSVRIDGREMGALDAADLAVLRRRHVGYVFQDYNLLAGLTAVENVAAPLELDGVAVREARSSALDRLGQVGLADRADAFPDDLSGGERQRVAIARAVIGQRRLLLADEPTGALDSATGGEVMALLAAACTTNSAVVVVTHDAEVAAWADRIVSLADGRVVADGPVAPTAGSAVDAGGGAVAGVGPDPVGSVRRSIGEQP